MSDFKSKMPDLKELGSITGKLFNDIKNSVGEIIQDYKQKHAEVATPAEKAEAKSNETTATAAEDAKKTDEKE